jgi:hypothetical protein
LAAMAGSIVVEIGQALKVLLIFNYDYERFFSL